MKYFIKSRAFNINMQSDIYTCSNHPDSKTQKFAFNNYQYKVTYQKLVII